MDLPRAFPAILLAWLAFAAGTVRADEILDFESQFPGSIVGEVLTRSGIGPVVVRGVNSRLGADRNAAVIFDSSRPTGGDLDLGTPNEGCPGGGPGRGAAGRPSGPAANCEALHNVLIVAENLADADNDGIVDDPDDEQVQRPGDVARLELDFTRFGSVSLVELTVLDAQRPVEVRLLDRDGGLIDRVPIAPTGDNGSARKPFPANSGVARVEIELRSSGAVDNLVFRPGPVTVPDVVGLPPGPAASALQSRWLELARPDLPGPYPLRIAAQAPTAGSRVPIGTSVAVELAVEVPDLHGLGLEAARGRLAARHLTDRDPAAEPAVIDLSADWLAYAVAAQEPSAGSFVPLGSPVALELATAVRVPEVRELGLSEARARLAERRLATETDREIGAAEWARYRVAAQRPAAGEWAPADSGVELTLGVTVRVPELADLPPGEASEVLAERGLAANLLTRDLPAGADFSYRVDAQLPEAGEWVAAGTPVALTVAGAARVPDVRGLEWSAAGRELGRKRLELAAAPPGFEPRPEITATVRAQRPAADAWAPMGSEVTAELDLQVTVPDVRGRRPESARGRLIDLGLDPGDRPDPPPAGAGAVQIVEDQDPRPGTRAPSGSAVRLTIGEVVVVPDVRGLTFPAAQANLAGRRLVGVLEGAEAGAEPPTTLVELQSLEPWSYARIGDSVVLGVAADEVEVPPLRGLSPERARERLESAGLRLDADLRYAEGSPVGVVLRQAPAAGARVERDRAVAVTLGRPLPPPDRWRIPWWWLLLLLLLLLALGLERLRRSGKASTDFRLEVDADLAGLNRNVRVSGGGSEPIGLDLRLRGRVDPGVQTLKIEDPSGR